MQKLKSFLKAKLSSFKKSRFLLAVVMLTIGVTSTIIFYEGKPLYELLTTQTSIEIVNASYEVAPQEDKSVQTDLLSNDLTTHESIEGLIARYFQKEAKTALAVAMCESSLDPSRIGDTHLAKPSIGLFQINQIWHPYTTEQLQDAEFNVKIAKEIVDQYGWTRWTCFKTEGYKKFIN